MQTVPKSGITIKQYGKFHLRETQLSNDQPEPARLQISLEQASNQEMIIGYIPPQRYELTALKQRIRYWLMEQQGQIIQVEQWKNDTQDTLINEKLQQLVEVLEMRYHQVTQAFQEIDTTQSRFY